MAFEAHITGKSIVTPLGNDPEEVFQKLLLGEQNFERYSEEQSGEFAPIYHGRCNDIEKNHLHDRKVQKVMSRRDVIGLIAAIKASKDAGLETIADRSRVGMMVGASSTQIRDLEPYLPLIKECVGVEAGIFDSNFFGRQLTSEVNPMVMLQNLMNNTLCYGSIALDIRGVNANYVDFQTSGLEAVINAWYSLKNGYADAILVGGVALSPDLCHFESGKDIGYLRAGGEADPLLSPYDQTANGTILSEGSCFLVLETAESAAKRGRASLGRILGGAVSGCGQFALTGDMNGTPFLPRSLRVAESLASSQSKKSGLVLGGGNGCYSMDLSEIQQLRHLSKFDRLKLTSFKGGVGELSEAASIFSIIMALQAKKENRIPSALGCATPMAVDDNLEILVEEDEMPDAPVIVNATSFNGLTASIAVAP